MDYRPAGDKPSYEPTMDQITFAYLRHSVSIS